MKVISITTIRQNATRTLEEARNSGEFILVVQRSKPVAYVVVAEQFEAMQDELKALRRQALLQDVAAAEREVREGKLRAYENVDELMADLDK